MDKTQDRHGAHGRNIKMPSEPVTRSWAKKLKRVFQAYVQEWINEKKKAWAEFGDP